MDQHEQAVKEIRVQIRGFYDRKQKYRVNHGSTNSTRPRDDHQNATVDVGHLNHILDVDVRRRTVLVEPNVPMDRLVEGTLIYGLVPPVVMEFPGITVGGGYAGTSGESSSFKHGFFDRTINYVHMILADGEMVKCSRTENADLFRGAAGAMGTLGIVTLVELQLIEAKKYVLTTYHPVSSVEQALEKLEVVTNDLSNDYVDGILFSKTCGAIVTGRMTDTIAKDTKIQTFSGTWDPWFYLHVKDMIASCFSSGDHLDDTSSSTATTTPKIEAIPLAEYLFRYDRGGFWVGASAFKYFHVPFNKLTRWFLDDFLHTRMMYTALHASRQSRQYVVQDLALPYENVNKFIEYSDREFGIWPLWLCPLRTPRYGSMHPHIQRQLIDDLSDKVEEEGEEEEEEEDKMLNIGLWGFGPPSTRTSFPSFLSLNRSLEHQLHLLGGTRWLYAHSYEPASEFWSSYHDRTWYDSLRSKYNATSLHDVYEKCRIDIDRQLRESEKWFDWFVYRSPYTSFLGGFWGIWCAIKSKTYVEARKAVWRGRDGVHIKNGSGTEKKDKKMD